MFNIVRLGMRPATTRSMMTRSAARRGHNFEDYFLNAGTNLFIYPKYHIAAMTAFSLVMVFGAATPVIQGNYYMEGRWFAPLDGYQQLTDDSW